MDTKDSYFIFHNPADKDIKHDTAKVINLVRDSNTTRNIFMIKLLFHLNR